MKDKRTAESIKAAILKEICTKEITGPSKDLSEHLRNFYAQEHVNEGFNNALDKMVQEVLAAFPVIESEDDEDCSMAGFASLLSNGLKDAAARARVAAAA